MPAKYTKKQLRTLRLRNLAKARAVKAAKRGQLVPRRMIM